MKQKNPWILKVFLFTFFMTLIVSGSSNYIATHMNFVFLIIITIIIIGIGIIFDIIGTSALTAKEANFHAMASKRVKGSKESILLIKNNSKIANFCNDVIGDICGIISGAMGAMISIYLSTKLHLDITITALFISSVISSSTVSFKAIGKKIAMKNCTKIIFLIGKTLNSFSIKNKA